MQTILNSNQLTGAVHLAYRQAGGTAARPKRDAGLVGPASSKAELTKLKTLIIDNFDSFTYNLYQYVAELGGNPEVFRNNEISLEDIARGGYTHIIISPGPGAPDNKKDFGICGEVIKKCASVLPILGVCLGHQGIIHMLGGRVTRAPIPVHGKRSRMKIFATGERVSGCLTPNIFNSMPKTIEAMRYHSLIGEQKSLPQELVVTAETAEDGLIMAVQHKKFPLYGVQFHPESIGTDTGKTILKNFLMVSLRAVAKQSRSLRSHTLARDDITEKQAEALLNTMASGKMPESKMAEVLTQLADKGESVSEIIGMARGMRKQAVKLKLGREIITMDLCGTGGSGLSRMNISTAAAFVLAACGVTIAKHGNRAASGRCGSFDVLEKLGVNIQLPPHAVSKSIQELGVGFIFAPLFHPAMKHIAPVRKKLGFRTIFNLLGPLTNPAHPKYHLLGVSEKVASQRLGLAEKLIEAMKGLDYTRAMVVAGEDGLDDVTLNGKTTIYELNRGEVKKFDFTPEEVGMKRVKNFKEIAGGDPAHNAKLFLQLLQGKGSAALRNLLLLNCAFALVVREIVQTVAQGIEFARHAIESGASYEKFLAYKTFSLRFLPFRAALVDKKRIKIIAELKRRSPSHGNFPPHDPKKLMKAYERGGARAISVVTEPKLFKGSLALLREVRAHTKLPILRKDFIKNGADIEETVAAGANAVLLIAKQLPAKRLIELANFAIAKGIDPVVEIHDQADLKKINGLRDIIIGINNRNLKTFKTNASHGLGLLPRINPNSMIIAESAFLSPKDLKPYKGKVNAALIGTALLTAKKPEKILKVLARA